RGEPHRAPEQRGEPRCPGGPAWRGDLAGDAVMAGRRPVPLGLGPRSPDPAPSSPGHKPRGSGCTARPMVVRPCLGRWPARVSAEILPLVGTVPEADAPLGPG